jgi:hypothetical protein
VCWATPIFSRNETGVELPSGCRRTLAYRGVGTQNYVCADPSNSGHLDWLLVEPIAVLHPLVIRSYFNVGIDGDHFFTSPGNVSHAGSGAGWRLGSHCGFFNCTSTSDQWLAQAAIKNSPQSGTIPWLLISKKSSFGPKFHNIDYVQRLATIGGLPPFDCHTLGTTYNAPYEADYVFSTCY